MGKCEFRIDISIHAKWKKPLFRKGYTEFTVVRETLRFYSGNDVWSRDTMTVLFKTDDFEKAVDFKNKMIEAGVKTV